MDGKQEQSLLLLVRKSFDLPENFLLSFLRHQLPLKTRLLQSVLKVSGIFAGGPAFLSDMIDKSIPRHSKEPRTEGDSLKGLQMVIGLIKSLLKDVLSHFPSSA